MNPLTGGDTTIPAVKIKPVSGGALHTLFTAPLNSQVLARAPRGQIILFTVNNDTTHVAQLYRINTDGTALKLLTSAKASYYTYDNYGDNSYLPWTNVSHDGKHYAILKGTNHTISLVIGNIDGGSPTTIAVSDNLILTHIVGWTTA
ncbi:hypothetical protein KDW_57930 [Dictyobacter vulcani]|uniref:Uncharacterized protein n=1 Tax=Dictyobacter vulcani TaxID=2607529 RepID=A0A5J4KYQ6_9CHLR|nr:hypothetical protein [Dictyobacter vulcani]GER91631.1 hypothetical protein KDW_57930 [Dictyobacter vulcani]